MSLVHLQSSLSTSVIWAADVFLGWLLGSLFLGTFQMAALALGDVCAMMLIDFPPSSQPQRRWLPSQRRLSGLRVGLAPVSKSAAYRGKTRRGNWDVSGSTRATRKTQHSFLPLCIKCAAQINFLWPFNLQTKRSTCFLSLTFNKKITSHHGTMSHLQLLHNICRE